jgi:hypothetical protein
MCDEANRAGHERKSAETKEQRADLFDVDTVVRGGTRDWESDS